MTTSVHTNKPALLALQQLNKTNDQLADVQSRVNTGLRVNGAKDNASVWAIAQGQRADVNALSAVKSSLDRATSITDVALAAGETISDLLNQLKEKVVSAKDTSLDTKARAALNSDYQAILKSITSTIQNAEFDGANILNNGTSIKFIANADANAFVTLQGKNLSLGGSIITMTATSSILTSTTASSVLTQLDASISNTNAALGQIGSQAKQIETHNKFVGVLADTLTSGIGNLVDADLAKESARLQALQVQQQLGAQALSIANGAPQVILSLFKG